jgi:hypothetical protein
VYVKESVEEKLATALDDIDNELGVSSLSGYLDEDSEALIQIVLGK